MKGGVVEEVVLDGGLTGIEIGDVAPEEVGGM